MFSHLEAVDDLADFGADLGGAQEFPGSAFDLFADFLKRLFGRVQEFASLTFPFLRKQRIEAGHEALTGEIRRMNLRQVLLVEQRQLQILSLEQLFDFFTAQGRDPTHTGMPFQFVNLGLRQHASVPHQDHPIQPKALLECVHLIRHRSWIIGITGINLHRKWTPLSIGAPHKQ